MARGISRAKNKQYQTDKSEAYFDKVSNQVESNQSRLTMVLGGLIILVVVILLFNYFNRSKPSVGPSQQTEQTQEDVSPQNLPGKYTIKEGDTLFTIAEKYYNNGYKYTEIARVNNLSDPNIIETGQQLEIPKLSDQNLSAASTPNPQEMQSPEPTPKTSPSSQSQSETQQAQSWGTQITGDTYTVAEGDWLSTISARAYGGDITAYTRIAQANNIQNPDLIYSGTILKIPR